MDLITYLRYETRMKNKAYDEWNRLIWQQVSQQPGLLHLDFII